MSAAAPPGWYVDPTAGRTRWWDGAGWYEAVADHPAPRGGGRRYGRMIIIAVVISFVLVALVGGCVALSVRAQSDFQADTATLADRLLQPTDLPGTWEVVEPDAPAPVGPTFSASAYRLDHVCPDARDQLTRSLVSAGDLASRGSMTGAEIRLVRPASEPGAGVGVVHEAVFAHWLGSNADEAFAAHARSRSCVSTWDYTAPDGSTWQVRNETISDRAFGAETVVASTTYTPVDVDGPGGEPVGADGATEYLNVVSRRDDQILLLSMVGLSVEDAATVVQDAKQKLAR